MMMLRPNAQTWIKHDLQHSNMTLSDALPRDSLCKAAHEYHIRRLRKENSFDDKRQAPLISSEQFGTGTAKVSKEDLARLLLDTEDVLRHFFKFL